MFAEGFKTTKASSLVLLQKFALFFTIFEIRDRADLVLSISLCQLAS